MTYGGLVKNTNLQWDKRKDNEEDPGWKESDF